FAVDQERALAPLDLPRIGAVIRVVFEKVGIRLCVRQIVHSDHFELTGVLLQDRPADLAADAAEPIDTDAGSHDAFLLGRLPTEYKPVRSGECGVPAPPRGGDSALRTPHSALVLVAAWIVPWL